MKNKIIERFSEIVVSENPSDDILERIQNNVNMGEIAAQNKKARKIVLKPILAVTMFVISLFLVSAVVYIPGISDIMQSLIFKGFEVNKFDSIGSPDYEIEREEGVLTSSWTFDITDSKVDQNQDLQFPLEGLYFDTIEEAGQYLVFVPTGLNYLPENTVFKDILLYKDGQNNYDKNRCSISYTKFKPDGAIEQYLYLDKQYVGENATMKINTILDIEKITLSNGIEALLMKEAKHELYNIVWIKNGIGYNLSGYFDRNEMIKMAESVD